MLKTVLLFALVILLVVAFGIVMQEIDKLKKSMFDDDEPNDYGDDEEDNYDDHQSLNIKL